MITAYKRAGATTAPAAITNREAGGFLAVASTGDLDRDGEIIAPGALSWQSATVPVHLDHTMSAKDAIGRGRPYYVGDKLMIDVTLASTPDAQLVRQKVAEGIIDSVSIVFLGKQWETIDGVRTCVKGELLATDVVSIPSQPNARILSSRSLKIATSDAAREAVADGLLALARLEIAEAKSLGIRTDRPGPNRLRADQMLRAALDAPSTHPRTNYDPRSL